jgi:uncharacterized membrane protein
MRGTAWTRGDVLVAGGAAVILAASADVAQTVQDRFAVDLAGLGALERAGATLWDLRPLGTAVFAVGALGALAGLGEPAGRLERLRELARNGVAILAAAHAALALVVLGLAVWVAALGEVGESGELGFVYSGSDRAVTLATQLVGWIPLTALLVLVAVVATRSEQAEEEPEPERSDASLSEEMEAIWRERLAHGPRRERARNLLSRIRALESAGEYEQARELADELRNL